ERLVDLQHDPRARLDAVSEPDARAVLGRADPRRFATASRAYEIVVEPTIAGASAWYELFPRSCGPGLRHGTLADAAKRLGYVAGLGFDVVYLPPIHPIGTTHRKGPDNSLRASEG